MVIDSHEHNSNPKKLVLPLLDIKLILQDMAAYLYCSLINRKDTYKEIRVIPEHVPYTLFIIPDGTMVSNML